MRTRIEILKDIIGFKSNLPALQKEILQYPWDIGRAEILISGEDILIILNKFIEREISDQDLEEWANLIECRDDIDFNEESLQEIIFTLANPEINGKITEEGVNEIIEKLKN